MANLDAERAIEFLCPRVCCLDFPSAGNGAIGSDCGDLPHETAPHALPTESLTHEHIIDAEYLAARPNRVVERESHYAYRTVLFGSGEKCVQPWARPHKAIAERMGVAEEISLRTFSLCQLDDHRVDGVRITRTSCGDLECGVGHAGAAKPERRLIVGRGLSSMNH